jgi:hypothetical protein
MPCRFIKVGHLPRPGAPQIFNPPSKPLRPHKNCLKFVLNRTSILASNGYPRNLIRCVVIVGKMSPDIYGRGNHKAHRNIRWALQLTASAEAMQQSRGSYLFLSSHVRKVVDVDMASQAAWELFMECLVVRQAMAVTALRNIAVLILVAGYAGN